MKNSNYVSIIRKISYFTILIFCAFLCSIFQTNYEYKNDYMFNLDSFVVTPSRELIDSWGIEKIQLENAWGLSAGSSSVNIGVIDTGIHYNLNINQTLSQSFSSINDPFCDYMIDSTHYGHGTLVSGIISGETIDLNNGNTFRYSSSEDLSVVSLQIDYSNQDDAIDGITSAIDYAENHNIRVLNLSGSCSTTLPYTSYQDLIYLYDVIENYDGIIICSSGNDGINIDNHNTLNSYSYPSNFDLPNIISVGAMNNNETVSSFSNYGVNSVDVFAPGEDIPSLGFLLENNVYNSFIVTSSGTSFAAPFVSAVAGLLFSMNQNFTPQQVKSFILNGSVSSSGLSNKCVTGGYVNAWNSLSLAHNHSISYTEIDDYTHRTQCTNSNCNYSIIENHTWRYRQSPYYMNGVISPVISYNDRFVPGYYCTKCHAYSPDDPSQW